VRETAPARRRAAAPPPAGRGAGPDAGRALARAGADVDLWDPTAVDELWSYGLRSVRSINQLQLLLRAVRIELAQDRFAQRT